MSTIKEFREFFLREAKVPSGAKADQEVGYPVSYTVLGVAKFNRFLQGHFPSEGVMQKLFESLTFKLNPEDTSTASAQGLSKIASDQNAYDRVNTDADSMATHIKPSQLPLVMNVSADTSITITKAKETVGAGDCAVFRIKISDANQTILSEAEDLIDQHVYLYIAGADDASGTGFTTTPATIAGKDYIAFLQSATYIASPVVGDFAGLWWAKGGSGSSTFDMRFDVIANIGAVTDEGDVFFATDTNAIYMVVSGSWVLQYTIPTAAAGTTYYTYVGYAEDTSGTGFSTSPDPTRTHIAFKISTTALTPVVGDFAGLWQQYLGTNGTSGTVINYATDTVVIVGTGVKDVVTFSDLISAGFTSPINGSTWFKINMRLYRTPDGSPTYPDALNESVTPVVDLTVDVNSNKFTADFQQEGTYRWVAFQFP